MEGVRRIDERGRLSEVFPDRNMVAEAVANPERIKHSVTLTREEWQVLFLVDGRRNLTEICRLAGNPDEMATLQILYNLVVANLIVVVPPLTPSVSVPEAVPAGPDFTHKFVPGGQAAPPPAPVAVEFSSGLPAPKPEDDTREIVNAKAVHYVGRQVRKLTVSSLALVSEGGAASSFPLTKDTATLGRHRNNDIVISDPKVSSFHARIDRSPDGFVLVDLKSRNGSFVNGKKIESCLLTTGDEIRVGMARLVYKVDYTSSS
jgi:hypothetical protein